jgi:hypothetical protein
MATIQMHDASYLLDEIAKGKTLYIQTCLRTTKVDKRCADRFAKAGVPVLKNGKNGALLLASGRSYVDASGCALVLQ